MMTDKERRLIEEAAYSVTKTTIAYSDLMIKQMGRSDGNHEQMEGVHESLRALNHATIAMERLCRILHGTEPDKEQRS